MRKSVNARKKGDQISSYSELQTPQQIQAAKIRR